MRRHVELLSQLRTQIGNTALITTVEVPEWVKGEEYSHSMNQVDTVGALKAAGKLETREGQIAVAALRECFDSSLIEMLQTDVDSREKLEINREREHIVVGDRIMSFDGQTDMLQLCENGAASAAQEAQTDERMEPVAVRCGADVRNVLRLKDMPIGTVRRGISMYPKESMDRHGKKFYNDLGFREHLGFFQWYYRIDEHTILAASYSVDSCDPAIMRKVWAKFGGKIPDDAPTDTWLDYAVEETCTLEEARAQIVAMRQDYYKQRGVDHIKRYSVDEFMAINKPAADEMFAAYLELALAHHTHKPNELVLSLVDGLLKNPGKLRGEICAQLRDIYNKKVLERADTALIEQLIRYAAAERLREGLKLIGTVARPTVAVLGVSPTDQSFIRRMATNMTSNIIEGVKHGRTYGGCTRDIKLSEEAGAMSEDDELNPMEAFSGRGGKSSSAEKDDEVCTYEHTGCYCSPYDDHGNMLDEPLKVIAKRRPGFVECKRDGCHAYMVLNEQGNPVKVDKGAIFAKAEQVAKKAGKQSAKPAEPVIVEQPAAEIPEYETPPYRVPLPIGRAALALAA